MSTVLQKMEPIRTPWVLKLVGAIAVLIPIAMMVTNTDLKIKSLTSHTEQLTAQTAQLKGENVTVSNELSEKKAVITDLNLKIEEGKTARRNLEIKIVNLEKRESRLEEVALLLKEELIVAEQESRLLAMNFQRSAKKLSSFASENEEAAYILARENEILKTAARDKDGQVLSLLTEVSTLNTELHFIKDERDELNSEILRVTARMRSLEAESTVMAVKNDDGSTVAIP